MSSTAIVFEAKQFHNVGDRLDLLADVLPVVSDALLAISGNGRFAGGAGCDEDATGHPIRIGKLRLDKNPNEQKRSDIIL